MHSEGKSGVFDVSEERSNDHNGQTDPEQDEEAAKVSIVAVGVKVRHPRHIVDGMEDVIFGVCSSLFAS